MRLDRILIRNLLALSLTACAGKPMQGSLPSAQEQEHHTIHVTACTEKSPVINGKCGDPSDTPLNVNVSAKDIYGNVIVAGQTLNGETILEFDTNPRAIIDLGYPRTTDDLIYCASPSVSPDGTEATIAYSDCAGLPTKEL